jgi:hypothetical protein
MNNQIRGRRRRGQFFFTGSSCISDATLMLFQGVPRGRPKFRFQETLLSRAGEETSPALDLMIRIEKEGHLSSFVSSHCKKEIKKV